MGRCQGKRATLPGRVAPGLFRWRLRDVPAGGEAHGVRAAEGEDLVYVQGGDAWSRGTIEIVDFPRARLRKTFVGTRSFATFPLDAAVDGGVG